MKFGKMKPEDSKQESKVVKGDDSNNDEEEENTEEAMSFFEEDEANVESLLQPSYLQRIMKKLNSYMIDTNGGKKIKVFMLLLAFT